MKIRQAYIKIYDKVNDEYLYKNKITGEIFSRKPRFLGKDDLPNPRLFNAPLNYDPGDPEEDAFALVVTVAVYNNDRIPEISKQVLNDHSALEELLPHR